MGANELRIGNYLKESNLIDFIKINITDIECIQRGDINYQSIPLTEDWLLRFGFIKNKFDEFFEIENCQIEIYLFDNESKYTVCVDSVVNKNIKYVHQLQNLYFALTGEELTLNNK